MFDMETLESVRTLIRAADDPPAFVVYNCVHPQGHTLIEQLKQITFETYDLQPCPVHLTQRAIHPEAQALGRAPQELSPLNHAVEELSNLLKFVRAHVNMPTQWRENVKQQKSRHS